MQTTEHCVRRGSHLWRTYIPISVSAGRGGWAVAVSLCLSPWPRVQHRLQTQDCNHCKILPHCDAKWMTYKTLNDSNMTLFGTFPHRYTDGNQFTWLREQLREFLTPNFAWGNNLLSGSCLGVYGAAPEVNFTSAMAQLPEERIHPTFESFCSPQTEVCWLQSLCGSQ